MKGHEMKELDQIIAEHEAGSYTELETYARIARVTTCENIDLIIGDLPVQYTEGFARWIRAYPYKHEAKGLIGEPLESFSDELIVQYKSHFWGSENPTGGSDEFPE